MRGGQIGAAVNTKFQSVIAKNAGLTNLRAIGKVLTNEDLTDAEKELTRSLKPTDFGLYRYAPVCSCDVERVFSRFKNVLRCNRENFTVEHLRWHLVGHCNSAALFEQLK